MERLLPSSIHAGEPLRPSDAETIERLVNGRVQHARRIFEREQRFVLDTLGELACIAGLPGTELTPEIVADVEWLIETQDEG